MFEERIENMLPVALLEKSIQSGSEYGWRQDDVLEVIEAARKLQIAIEGGLVQYLFEEGTCELHWLHYFTDEIKKGENWVNYCNRTAKEASDKFRKIISGKDIKKEAMESFELVRIKASEPIDVDQHKIFIISFERKPDNPNPSTQKRTESKR